MGILKEIYDSLKRNPEEMPAKLLFLMEREIEIKRRKEKEMSFFAIYKKVQAPQLEIPVIFADDGPHESWETTESFECEMEMNPAIAMCIREGVTYEDALYIAMDLANAFVEAGSTVEELVDAFDVLESFGLEEDIEEKRDSNNLEKRQIHESNIPDYEKEWTLIRGPPPGKKQKTGFKNMLKAAVDAAD